MPRLKNKPICLDEETFVDWLEDIYYFRPLDQGQSVENTPLRQAENSDQARQEFLAAVRVQLVRFELTFPLVKLPSLYAKAIREISLTQPTTDKTDLRVPPLQDSPAKQD